MFAFPTTFKPSAGRHLSEVALTRPSLTAPHALALTSKQRVVSVDLLQSIARLLRSVAPRLEAAALQEAMQDAEATEFVTAAMAQAETSASNESTMTGSASGVPSVSFFHIDGGESLPAASQLSTSDGAPATVRLAAVLRTRPTASTTGGHSTLDDASDTSEDDNRGDGSSTSSNGGSSRSTTTTAVRSRPRRLTGLDNSTSSATNVPSITRSPHSRSGSVHSARKSSSKLLSKVAPSHATPTENQPYRFPKEWFDTSAVERLARPHPPLPNLHTGGTPITAAAAPSARSWGEQQHGADGPPPPLMQVDTPEESSDNSPSSHDAPSHLTRTSAAPSTTSSTASFASLPTTTFAEAETPLAAAAVASPSRSSPGTASATHTLPPPISTTAPSGTVLKSAAPASPELAGQQQQQPQQPPFLSSLSAPPATGRDLAADTKLNSLTSYFSPSPMQNSNIGGYGAVDDRATVTTAQPPLFVDGMLLDPASGRFLFGGHAFREEARVLYVPPSLPMPADATTTTAASGGSDASSGATTATTATTATAAAAAAALRNRLFGLASATIAPSSNTGRHEASSLLLVREYFPVFSVSATTGGAGDGGRGLMSIDASAAPPDDVVVQCFSLLPPWLTQVQPNRYHLLSEAVTIACVCQALPGCVTTATSLSRFMRGGRYFSLTAGSQSSQPASQFIETFSPFGGHFRGPNAGYGGALAFNFSPPFTSPLQSLTSPIPTPPQPSSQQQQLQQQRPSQHGSSPDPQRGPIQQFNYMGALAGGGGIAGRQSLALSIHASGPHHVDGMAEEVEAARIMAVAERFSAVPPDVLDEALVAVRHSLAFFADYAERRQRMRSVLRAVRVLQRFFRRCLAVKRRALRRMTRMWRTLEVEARLKLQQHRALPSAVERIDAVANSILQEHMLTSMDYKRKFIKEEWARRRAAFAQWKEEEDWNTVFAEEQQARLDTYANSNSGAGGAAQVRNTSGERREEGAGSPMAPFSGARQLFASSAPSFTPSSYHVGPARPRSARLTAEEEQRMTDAFERRHAPRLKPRQSTAGPTPTSPSTSQTHPPGPPATTIAAAAAGSSARPSLGTFLPALSITAAPAQVAAAAAGSCKEVPPASSRAPSVVEVQTRRREAALRRFCSWYMDPHELLYLSHQRLLETLKGSVLRMEEVQSELKRAAAEVARDATASGS